MGMIKGWRLDPAWVAHYERRDRERFSRQIEQIKTQTATDIQKIRDRLNERWIKGGPYPV